MNKLIALTVMAAVPVSSFATPLTPPASAEVQSSAAAPAPTKLYQGTPVSMRLLRELTTKDKALKVGDRFDLELVDPLQVGSVTIIPSGTRGVGEIMSVRNKGMWGKSGHFDARLIYLQIGDRRIRLTGTFDDKGTAGGWAAGLTTAFIFAPAGFFMTGTSAKIAAGTVVKGQLDEDVSFMISEVQQSNPLVVVPSTAK